MMSLVHKTVSIFRVPGGDPELTISQFHAVSRQVPMLYAVLLLNTVAVAATHLRCAPLVLTCTVPGFLIVAGVSRILAWARLRRAPIGAPQALRILKATTRSAALMAFFFVTWALCLFPYGDAFARTHVEFYVSITVIACIFCLMHLRPAAFLVTLIVVVPSTIVFVLSGRLVTIAIAINFLLVSFCMVLILIRHHRDFIALSDSKKEVSARQIETQRLSDENFQLANVDTLTNLANRRGFFRDLDAALDRQKLTQRNVAVGLIDLDGFKPVNDVFGHATGDAVLHEVGRRIASFAGPSVSFARLGGDEFGFIVSDQSDFEILALADSLCRLLRAPYVMAEATAEISASIGLAVFPRAGRTAVRLFEGADYALYYAKQNRRGTPVVFSDRHRCEIGGAARIEQALRHADLDLEFSLAFQPIVDCIRGETVAFECLARWTSPVLGTVEPAAFIKAAERSDMINKLTQNLLRRALALASHWPDPVCVSFNLSVRDIASDDSVRRIIDIVKASQVRPARISFEITETAVMRDFEQARQALLSLRELGVGIALDDFGTGYSSLSYVHRLPLDRVKVDRSFTADVDRDPACRNIVKTVLDLCRNLGLCCVVEGLETEAQVGLLRNLGCSLLQGYIFGRPMLADAVAAYLATGLFPATPDFDSSPEPFVLAAD